MAIRRRLRRNVGRLSRRSSPKHCPAKAAPTPWSSVGPCFVSSFFHEHAARVGTMSPERAALTTSVRAISALRRVIPIARFEHELVASARARFRFQKSQRRAPDAEAPRLPNDEHPLHLAVLRVEDDGGAERLAVARATADRALETCARSNQSGAGSAAATTRRVRVERRDRWTTSRWSGDSSALLHWIRLEAQGHGTLREINPPTTIAT